MPCFLLVLFIVSSIACDAFADPTLSQVRHRALKHAGLDGPDHRFAARARWSSILPRVTARTTWLDDEKAGTREKNNFFRDDTSTLLHEWTQSETDHDTQTRNFWSVQATWDLSKLIFHRDELAADHRAATHRRERMELEERIARLFTRWRSLRTATTADAILERQTTAAILDGLTGGWFLKQEAR